MTTQAAPQAGSQTAGDSRTVNPSPDQGGSPDVADVQAGGDIGDDEPIEEGLDEGHEPEGALPEGGGQSEEGSGGQQIDPKDEQIADLQSQLEAAQSLIVEIGDRMERDPDLAARLEGRSPQNGNGKPANVREAVAKTLRERIKPEAAEALVEALDPFLERYERLEREFNRLAPQVTDLRQSVGSKEFVEGLMESGVTQATLNDRRFQRHLTSLRASSDFQALESRNKRMAAEHAALKWQASTRKASQNRDEQSRIATARTGRVGNQPARGASNATRVIEIKREPGNGHVDKAHRFRMEAGKAGKPLPVIKYID